MLPSLGKTILLLLGVVVVLATALPLLRAEAWWVRIFDFPRVQVLFLGTTVLALYAPLSHLRPNVKITFLLLLSGSLAYQGWCIFPYTIFAKEEVRASSDGDNEQTLRLLVANVLMSNRNADDLHRIIAEERPDIVLALEADRWWEERLRSLEKEFPHTSNSHRTTPMACCCTPALNFSKARSTFSSRRAFLRFGCSFNSIREVLSISGVCIPSPPTPAESESSIPRDAELLLVGRAVRELRHPVIVAGDLNDVAWSRTTRLFQKISGLLDPRIGRGRFSTFHAKYPILRWPLDHVFHSDHFRLVELKVLPAFGSDHFPILAALSFEPEKKEEQKEPEAGPEDREEAQEKIDEGMREEKQ